MKAEEQLIHDIVVFEERITREINLTESTDGEEITKLKTRQLNAVRNYASEIASKQREADNKIFKDSMEVRLSILVKAALMEINETPLVTNKE